MTAGRDARRAAALVVAGAAPFVLARALYEPAAGGGVDGPALPCPFRAATGLPCPLCGATRAVALAAHGDPAFLDFGAVWVVVLVAVAVAGVARLVLPARPLRAPPLVPLTLVTLTAAWAWALAHADAIA